MSKWMEKLIKKHTCNMCSAKIDKKEIYTVNLDTLDGPHSMTLCEKCAMEFDDMLKDLEEVLHGKRL